MYLLIINPGSTSTKIAIFKEDDPIWEKEINHDRGELSQSLAAQHPFRKKLVLKALKEAGFALDTLDAVVGRGGLLVPMPGGTYPINEAMLRDLRTGVQGQHPSNLGGLIAAEIAAKIKKPAFIVDPVVVDELEPISRVSGHPRIKRRSIFHALNQKAVARQYSQETGKEYENTTIIVAHMGGGISVGIHHNGRVIDVNDALTGEGSFTPQRSGTLPPGELVRLCYSGFSREEVEQALAGKGGLVAYFGTYNVQDLLARMESEPEVKLVIDAMIYQISKEIAALSVSVCGQVDAILLTGGLAYSEYITGEIIRRVSFIAETRCYPGSKEHTALAQGALRVLRGQEEGRVYEKHGGQ